MGWRDDRSAGRYGQPPHCLDLADAYTRLESAYRSLQAENHQLKARLDEMEPLFNRSMSTLQGANAVAQTLHDELLVAHAQRDILREGAKLLSRRHGYERQDGQTWCVECRYAYPCVTREIADHALSAAAEAGPLGPSPLFSNG